MPDSQETEAAKQFEKQGVQLAESGKLKESLEIFAKAINVAPKWSSSYNNRAQVYRLLNQNKGIYEHFKIIIARYICILSHFLSI